MLEPESDIQEENGYYQVKCLSDKAQDFYSMAEDLKVFEYFPARERHLRPFGTRYTIIWGPYYRQDLTSEELEETLERLADALPDAERLAGRLYDAAEDMDRADYLESRERDLKALSMELLQAREAAPIIYKILESGET